MRIALTLILTAFMGVAYATPHTCPALASQGFSESQIAVMYRSFEIGKINDMSYSLAAIAWKESSAGVHLYNPHDPSAGVFQITIKNALAYVDWEDNEYNRGRITQLLIDDLNLAAEFAMINLKFWKAQYGNDWRLIWQSYNGGYSGSEASKKYAADIVRKIKVIKQCDWG